MTRASLKKPVKFSLPVLRMEIADRGVDQLIFEPNFKLCRPTILVKFTFGSPTNGS